MHAIPLPDLLRRGDGFVPIEQCTPPSEEAILAGIYTPPVLAQVATDTAGPRPEGATQAFLATPDAAAEATTGPGPETAAAAGAPPTPANGEATAPATEASRSPSPGPPPGPVSGDVSGETVILWGMETVRRAHTAGVQTLYCRELGVLSPTEAIETVLTVENRPGAYSLGELVEVIALLDRFGHSPTMRIRALVDGKKRGLLAQASRTYALPAAVRARVTGGEVSLRHGEQLAELPDALRAALETHLESGSFSSRRELLSMTWESWKRFREDEPTIERRLIDALSSSEPREPLRQVRYPSYAEARAELERFRSSYIAGSGLKLEEPPNFEGDEFTLLLSFRSKDDLRRKVDHLSTRVLPAVGEITDLLG